MRRKIIITSGYFNPIHKGHINLLKGAKKIGGFLVVIVNNDKQVKLKGGVPFMEEKERVGIIKSLKYVDKAFLSIDRDKTVAKSLEYIAKKYRGSLYFAKGGDRNFDNIPEKEKNVCQKFNIKVINGVGGGKVQSSSWLLTNVSNKNKVK